MVGGKLKSWSIVGFDQKGSRGKEWMPWDPKERRAVRGEGIFYITI